MPAGLIAAFRPLTHASLFLVLYGVTAIYFSGVMVQSPARHLFCCYTFHIDGKARLLSAKCFGAS